MVPAASSLSLPSLESNIQSVFNGHLESLIKFQLGLRFSLLAWLISDSAGCEVGGGGGVQAGKDETCSFRQNTVGCSLWFDSFGQFCKCLNKFDCFLFLSCFADIDD